MLDRFQSYIRKGSTKVTIRYTFTCNLDNVLFYFYSWRCVGLSLIYYKDLPISLYLMKFLFWVYLFHGKQKRTHFSFILQELSCAWECREQGERMPFNGKRVKRPFYLCMKVYHIKYLFFLNFILLTWVWAL